MPKIAITGPPGVGKSTVVRQVIERLTDLVAVGGVLTSDKRVEGKRIGFEIIDIATGARGTLADQEKGAPRVGRYAVNLADLENIGVRALESALECDLIVVDEVGPMELKSPKFAHAVEKILASQKTILIVVKQGYTHPLAQNIFKTFKIITVTKDNRDSLPEEIARKLCIVRRSKP